jgi:hypothetical protein
VGQAEAQPDSGQQGYDIAANYHLLEVENKTELKNKLTV